jgi:hypothetical protein
MCTELCSVPSSRDPWNLDLRRGHFSPLLNPGHLDLRQGYVVSVTDLELVDLDPVRGQVIPLVDP